MWARTHTHYVSDIVLITYPQPLFLVSKDRKWPPCLWASPHAAPSAGIPFPVLTARSLPSFQDPNQVSPLPQ